MRKLIDYLPIKIQVFREIKAINETEQPEMNLLWENLDNFLKDQFVSDSTERGVSRWEKILKIIPKGTASLEDRKFTILTRLNESLPFTLTKLKQQLTTLCGADGFQLTLNADEYTISVRVALIAKNAFDDVTTMLKRMLPANMVVKQDLIYNQYETLATFTHEQLRAWTHYQLRNEVLV